MADYRLIQRLSRAGGQHFLLREGPEGRQISWRLWLLVWLLPGLFLIAAVLMLGYEGYRHLTWVPAEGEVVRVYSWEGETFMDRGEMQYSPVFRYTWGDGAETEASAGMRHADWNFEIGSTHEVRFNPNMKTDVLLPGPINFFAGLIVGAIGLVFLPFALFATWRLRRWQRAGR